MRKDPHPWPEHADSTMVQHWRASARPKHESPTVGAVVTSRDIAMVLSSTPQDCERKRSPPPSAHCTADPPSSDLRRASSQHCNGTQDHPTPTPQAPLAHNRFNCLRCADIPCHRRLPGCPESHSHWARHVPNGLPRQGCHALSVLRSGAPSAFCACASIDLPMPPFPATRNPVYKDTPRSYMTCADSRKTHNNMPHNAPRHAERKTTPPPMGAPQTTFAINSRKHAGKMLHRHTLRAHELSDEG